MVNLPDDNIFEEMASTIVNMERDKAKELAEKAIGDKINLLQAIERGFGEGIRRVGELFNEGEFFLPELMLSSQIMQEAIEIFKPHLKKDGQEIKTHGKVVIATIEGDIHSIGKTLVGTMLKANGFDVYDLGADVPVEKIVDTAIDIGADVIGISALLTTTMIGQKKVVDSLIEKGIRKNFKVIIGGAPITPKWTEMCGADGYAENAIESVNLVKKILEN